MARRCCRWRRMLICVCVPLLCFLLFLTCVCAALVIALQPDNISRHPTVKALPIRAPGAIRMGKYAASPKIFWAKKDEVAFWNQLQKAVDRNFHTLHLMMGSEPGQQYTQALLSHSLSELQRNSQELSHRVRALPEQLQNYVSSMSRRQYPVLMEPRGQCGFGATQERGPLLLLAIKTSARDYRRRQAVRESWGRGGWVWAQRGGGGGRGAYVHRVFLLGTERSSELRDTFSELMHLENQHYGDILQWDVWDTPLNGTVKQLLFWSWFRDTCAHVSFVFEGDDEAFVNTPALVSLLQDQLHRPPANSSLRDFTTGHVVYGGQPNRSPASQEFIPESFYRGWYPSYARGTGRLSSAPLLRRLLQVSHRVHLFPIEQVYVGMCLIRLNLSPRHHPAFLPSDWTEEQEEQPCAAHGVLLLLTHSPTHMLQLWDGLGTDTGLCSNVTVKQNIYSSEERK